MSLMGDGPGVSRLVSPKWGGEGKWDSKNCLRALVRTAPRPIFRLVRLRPQADGQSGLQAVYNAVENIFALLAGRCPEASPLAGRWEKGPLMVASGERLTLF